MAIENYGLEQTAAPAAEPVLAADVRTWAQIGSTAGEYADAVINDRIKAARELLESQVNIALITQTWKMYLDYFPRGCNGNGNGNTIRLVRGPWQSVTSITYVDQNGATQTLSSSLYRVDLIRGRITPIYGQSWPAAQYVTNAITVTFVSGYGAAGSNCPAEAREALLEIVADRVKNRGGVYAIPAGTREKLNALWPGRL